MKLKFSRQIFEKYSTVEFHENPFTGSRVVPCGRTDGQADMTKLIMAFRNFVNAPKNFGNTLSEPTVELLALNLVAYKETIAP
jgi:hypothetical protein